MRPSRNAPSPAGGAPSSSTSPSTVAEGGTADVMLVEVAPRDGLQADPADLPTATKVELILRAVRAGIRRIETVSFVNPDRVPKMADADAVMAALHTDGTMAALGARSIGLALNGRGLDRAVETGVDEVNAVVVCTDTFARRNQGRDTDGLVEVAAEICERGRAAGLPVSITLAAAFGCPYEGEVPLDRLAGVITAAVDAGPAEIALADSIGAGVPTDVTERVALAREIIGDAPIALRAHFHNSRNTGLANAAAAVTAGVRVIDASLGGVGGCPFAPRATGNIPTEDVTWMLHRMGHPTGVDLPALCEAAGWIEGELGHGVPGLVAKAGIFPDVVTAAGSAA
jgi:hydroxymethylglutaryl-CoA lyase